MNRQSKEQLGNAIREAKKESVRISRKILNHRIKKQKNYGRSVWNFFDPPIRTNIPLRMNEDGYEFLRKREDFGKPNLEEQTSYIHTFCFPTWNMITQHDKDNLKDINMMNLFDKIFSPTMVFQKVDENTKFVYKRFQKIPYLSAEELGILHVKCEEIQKKMMETRKEALMEIEKMMTSQLQTFETEVMEKISSRKIIMEKISESDFSDKLKENNVIFYNDEEDISLSRPFSNLILKCGDVFRVIFSFLETSFILRNICPSCSYFLRYVQENVDLSITVFPGTMDLVPLDTILSAYRVKEFSLGTMGVETYFFGRVNSRTRNLKLTQHRPLISNKDIFQNFLTYHKENLRKIELFHLENCQVGKCLFEPNSSVWNNNSNSTSGGGGKGGGLSQRHVQREFQLRNVLKNSWQIYDQLNECKRLEVLFTPVLPSQMENLKNLRELHYPINFCYLSEGNVFSNERSFWNQFYGNYRSYEDIKTLTKALNSKVFTKKLKVLSFFEKKYKHHIPSHLTRMIRGGGGHGGGGGIRRDKSGNWKRKVRRLLIRLYNSIEKNIETLEKFTTRMMFGFACFSNPFISFLSNCVSKSVFLYYSGDGVSGRRREVGRGGRGGGGVVLGNENYDFSRPKYWVFEEELDVSNQAWTNNYDNNKKKKKNKKKGDDEMDDERNNNVVNVRFRGWGCINDEEFINSSGPWTGDYNSVTFAHEKKDNYREEEECEEQQQKEEEIRDSEEDKKIQKTDDPKKEQLLEEKDNLNTTTSLLQTDSIIVKKEEKTITDDDEYKNIVKCTVAIKNLPKNINILEISEQFGSTEILESIHMVKSHIDGNRVGLSYLRFKREEDLEKVLLLYLQRKPESFFEDYYFNSEEEEEEEEKEEEEEIRHNEDEKKKTSISTTIINTLDDGKGKTKKKKKVTRKLKYISLERVDDINVAFLKKKDLKRKHEFEEEEEEEEEKEEVEGELEEEEEEEEEETIIINDDEEWQKVYRISVNHFPEYVTKKDMRKLFGMIEDHNNKLEDDEDEEEEEEKKKGGEIVKIYFPVYNDTKTTKGICFIDFRTKKGAERAILQNDCKKNYDLFPPPKKKEKTEEEEESKEEEDNKKWVISVKKMRVIDGECISRYYESFGTWNAGFGGGFNNFNINNENERIENERKEFEKAVLRVYRFRKCMADKMCISTKNYKNNSFYIKKKREFVIFDSRNLDVEQGRNYNDINNWNPRNVTDEQIISALKFTEKIIQEIPQITYCFKVGNDRQTNYKVRENNNNLEGGGGGGSERRMNRVGFPSTTLIDILREMKFICSGLRITTNVRGNPYRVSYFVNRNDEINGNDDVIIYDNHNRQDNISSQIMNQRKKQNDNNNIFMRYTKDTFKEVFEGKILQRGILKEFSIDVIYNKSYHGRNGGMESFVNVINKNNQSTKNKYEQQNEKEQQQEEEELLFFGKDFQFHHDRFCKLPKLVLSSLLSESNLTVCKGYLGISYREGEVVRLEFLKDFLFKHAIPFLVSFGSPNYTSSMNNDDRDREYSIDIFVEELNTKKLEIFRKRVFRGVGGGDSIMDSGYDYNHENGDPMYNGRTGWYYRTRVEEREKDEDVVLEEVQNFVKEVKSCVIESIVKKKKELMYSKFRFSLEIRFLISKNVTKSERLCIEF